MAGYETLEYMSRSGPHVQLLILAALLFRAPERETKRFMCPGQLQLVVERHLDGAITVTDWSNERFELTHHAGDYRGRYVNPTEHVIFFEGGQHATFTVGDVIHDNCTVVPERTRVKP
jgi:hypothetical protein